VQLPDILSDKNLRGKAAELLQAYFEEETSTGFPRTGSRFESWRGGGSRVGSANVLTEEDILAVSFLGVRVKGAAAFGLLHTHEKEITRLLLEIPSDLDLVDLKSADLDETIGSGTSAASRLWSVFTNASGPKWGIGSTTASKLLARKRPRLIPVYDSVIDRVTGLGGTARNQWTDWHTALTQTDLPRHLEEIRALSGIKENISQLRVMDVVLWMHGIKQGIEPLENEDEAA